MELSILYRGHLVSCNYGCEYCPFAKRRESRDEQARDREALERFVEWLEHRPEGDSLSVLFTPWGEALVRRWYRAALARLTKLPAVRVAGAQTNLSGPLDFLRDARAEKLSLWCTFHPEWTDRERFVSRVREVRAAGARASVGLVGFRRFLPLARALRAELPEDVYLWINIPKSSEVLDEAEMDALEAIDPLVRVNASRHPSRGRACLAGETSISVDGEGTVRRCHFVTAPLGNLYEGELEAMLAPRTCPAPTCGCHIGYVNLPHLGLRDAFAADPLFRAPGDWPFGAEARSVGEGRRLPLYTDRNASITRS